MEARERPAVLGVVLEPEGDRLVVVLDGALDGSTGHLVDSAVRECPGWVEEVVIDLTAVREIGPGGDDALANAYVDLVESGRRVVVRREAC